MAGYFVVTYPGQGRFDYEVISKTIDTITGQDLSDGSILTIGYDYRLGWWYPPNPGRVVLFGVFPADPEECRRIYAEYKQTSIPNRVPPGKSLDYYIDLLTAAERELDLRLYYSSRCDFKIFEPHYREIFAIIRLLDKLEAIIYRIGPPDRTLAQITQAMTVALTYYRQIEPDLVEFLSTIPRKVLIAFIGSLRGKERKCFENRWDLLFGNYYTNLAEIPDDSLRWLLLNLELEGRPRDRCLDSTNSAVTKAYRELGIEPTIFRSKISTGNR